MSANGTTPRMHTTNSTSQGPKEIKTQPKKKARLDDAHAAIRCADPGTSLEVDILILDYLAHQTTIACLASRMSQQSSVPLAHNLTMADTFLPIFRARHSSYRFDAELRFRLVLLKLVTLLTQRLTRNPSTPPKTALQRLRDSNKHRAMTWIASEARMPTAPYNTASFQSPSSFPSSDELERNRAHMLHELGIPAEDEAYEDAHCGTNNCVALLDLLPLFMQVSAARVAMSEVDLTEQWKRMACEWFLQAVLEQYLVCGASGTDAVDEAFAWGYQDSAVDAMEVDSQTKSKVESVDEVNDMFTDGSYEEEVKDWADTKRAYLDMLFLSARSVPSSSKSVFSVLSSDDGEGEPVADLVSHLEMLAAKHPITSFEADMMQFLAALSQSIPRPVLVQLEGGQLDGMSKAETKQFVESCGINVGKLLGEMNAFDVGVGLG